MQESLHKHVERTGMGHQLLVGQHWKAPNCPDREMSLPSGNNHEIPGAEITHTVDRLQ